MERGYCIEDKYHDMWGDLMDVKHDTDIWSKWKPSEKQHEFAMKNDWKTFLQNKLFPCSFIEYMAIHLYHGGRVEEWKQADRLVMVALG